MLFWIICVVLAVGVGGLLITPLIRTRDSDSTDASDVDIYRDQLAEIERDIARGVLSGDEAERTRTEIARRLLAADAAAPRAAGTAPQSATIVAALLSAGVVCGGGLWLFWTLGAVDGNGPFPDVPREARLEASAEARATRPSQTDIMAERMAIEPVQEPDAEFADVLETVRAAIVANPDDTEGLEWAARLETRIGNYPAAIAAREALLRLATEGSDAARTERVRLIDLMVFAVDGYVSPEAESHAIALLEEDPESIPGRFYIGLLYDQTDRPDLAFRLWRGVIADGAADSPHVRFARQFITETAFRAGVEYELPALPGPTSEQMEAAEDMDPEARAQMIQSMVDSLSSRLAERGGTPDEWARLITALSVLGDTEQAALILEEARIVYRDTPNALDLINAAAAQSGLE